MNRTLTFHGRLPGVVCEIALPPQQENPLRLDVTGFVGLAERGPLNIPVALHDIEQYRAVFGGDLPLARMRQGSQIVYANLQRAVQAFFDNGGRRCYVVRVAGAQAQANQFRIPGLLAWDSNAQTLRPVVAPAAWPGRWSATIGVGTQLLSQPLPLAKKSIDWDGDGNFALHLVLPTTTSVQKNDVLRLHFAGEGKPLIYCYADTPQSENNGAVSKNNGTIKVRGIPVSIRPQDGTQQAFSNNIQPLPVAISVGKQQGNDCKRLAVQKLYLDELEKLDDGYVLRVTSTEQFRQADVLCIDCLGGEELLFPVELVTEQSGNGSVSSGQSDYILTSRSPTWKLTPTHVEHLTGCGWEPLQVLLSGPQLEVMTRNGREYILHLKTDDASGIEVGDVLRVICKNGSRLLFPVSDVQISSTVGASSPPVSSRDTMDAKVISQQALWLFTPSLTSSVSSSAESSYGELLQVDLLTFNLYVREEETVVETWNDLRFGLPPASAAAMQNGMQSQANALVARSWLDVLVPSADDLRKEIAHPGVVQRDIPGLDPTCSARLGVPNPLPAADDGTAVAPLYFPLCMDDLPLPDEFAGPLDAASAFVLSSGGASAYVGGTDDLETFKPESLFLDSKLAGVGYRDLINEANALLFASPDVEVDPFLGLHSLLFIDEIGIVALPDLPQRGWSKEPPQVKQPPPPPPPPPPAERDWSSFLACSLPLPEQPCQETTTESEPELDLPFIETPDEYSPAELTALIEVQHALVNFCAARADVLGVLSLPLHFKKREVLDWQQRFTSAPDFMDGVPLSYVAVYHPWLQIHEEIPLQAVVSRSVPPDGAVCGMIAARELARGPWIAIANVPLLSVIGLSPVLTASDWEAIFNAQVNLVRQLPGQFTLMSAHTLSLEDTFLQISVRRLLIFLRKLALLRGMRYVFEANNERFRERVQTDFEAALTIMAQRGAISAFEVVTDSSINTQNDYDNGRFIIAIRVAPTLPIEFITVVLLRAGEDLLQVIEG